MAKAKKVTLISFTLPNKVGQLAAVTELIAGAKLDVQGFQAVEAGASAEFRRKRRARSGSRWSTTGVGFRGWPANLRTQGSTYALPGQPHSRARQLPASSSHPTTQKPLQPLRSRERS